MKQTKKNKLPTNSIAMSTLKRLRLDVMALEDDNPRRRYWVVGRQGDRDQNGDPLKVFANSLNRGIMEYAARLKALR